MISHLSNHFEILETLCPVSRYKCAIKEAKYSSSHITFKKNANEPSQLSIPLKDLNINNNDFRGHEYDIKLGIL